MSETRAQAPRWRALAASAGAFLAALLAGSHHSLHMLLLSVGLGGSSLLVTPALRRAMLALSLVMTGLSTWWFLRKLHKACAETVAVFAAIGASLVVLVWTVVKHGF